MFQMALSYIRGNKRHAYITIFGIAVSVLMIYFLLQCVGVLQGQALAIISNGSTYDCIYHDNDEILLRVADDMKELGYTVAYINEFSVSQIGERNMYLQIDAVEGEIFEFTGTSILDGEFPDSDYEICVDETYCRLMDCGVGDKIIIDCMDEQGKAFPASFVISGIISDYAGTETEYRIAYTTRNTALDIIGQKGYEFNSEAMVVTKMPEYNDLDRTFSEYSDFIDVIIRNDGNLVNLSGSESIDYALRESDSYASLSKGFLVIIFLAFLCLFLFVYCSIAISMNKRYSQFGVLRCLGGTKMQLIQLYLFEECLYGICGMAMGIVAGMLLGRFLVMKVLNLFYEVSYYVVPIWIIPVTAGFVFMAIVFALGVMYAVLQRLQPMEMINFEENNAKIKFKRGSAERGEKREVTYGGMLVLFARRNLERNRSRNRLVFIVILLTALMLTIAGNSVTSLDWHSYFYSVSSFANIEIFGGNIQSAITTAVAQNTEMTDDYWITSEQLAACKKIYSCQNAYWYSSTWGINIELGDMDKNVRAIVFSDELLALFCRYNGVTYPETEEEFICQVFSEEPLAEFVTVMETGQDQYCFPGIVETTQKKEITCHVQYGLSCLTGDEMGGDYIVVNERVGNELFGNVDAYTGVYLNCRDVDSAIYDCTAIFSKTQNSVISLEADADKAKNQLIGMAFIMGILFVGLFLISIMIVQNMNEENINARKKEFGMLISIGADKELIEHVLILETFSLSVKASVVAFIIATPISIYIYGVIWNQKGIGVGGYILSLVFLVIGLLLVSAVNIHKSMKCDISELLQYE